MKPDVKVCDARNCWRIAAKNGRCEVHPLPSDERQRQQSVQEARDWWTRHREAYKVTREVLNETDAFYAKCPPPAGR